MIPMLDKHPYRRLHLVNAPSQATSFHLSRRWSSRSMQQAQVPPLFRTLEQALREHLPKRSADQQWLTVDKIHTTLKQIVVVVSRSNAGLVDAILKCDGIATIIAVARQVNHLPTRRLCELLLGLLAGLQESTRLAIVSHGGITYFARQIHRNRDNTSQLMSLCGRLASLLTHRPPTTLGSTPPTRHMRIGRSQSCGEHPTSSGAMTRRQRQSKVFASPEHPHDPLPDPATDQSCHHAMLEALQSGLVLCLCDVYLEARATLVAITDTSPDQATIDMNKLLVCQAWGCIEKITAFMCESVQSQSIISFFCYSTSRHERASKNTTPRAIGVSRQSNTRNPVTLTKDTRKSLNKTRPRPGLRVTVDDTLAAKPTPGSLKTTTPDVQVPSSIDTQSTSSPTRPIEPDTPADPTEWDPQFNTAIALCRLPWGFNDGVDGRRLSAPQRTHRGEPITTTLKQFGNLIRASNTVSVLLGVVNNPREHVNAKLAAIRALYAIVRRKRCLPGPLVVAKDIHFTQPKASSRCGTGFDPNTVPRHITSWLYKKKTADVSFKFPGLPADTTPETLPDTDDDEGDWYLDMEDEQLDDQGRKEDGQPLFAHMWVLQTSHTTKKYFDKFLESLRVRTGEARTSPRECDWATIKMNQTKRSSSKPIEMVVNEYSREAVRDFLYVLYTGNCDDVVHPGNAVDMMKIAHRCGMRMLFDRCQVVLAEMVNPENVVSMCEVAFECGSTLVADKCMNALVREFESVDVDELFGNTKVLGLLVEELRLILKGERMMV